MTEAILLLACLVLAGAVVALAVSMRRQRNAAADALAALRAEQAVVERRLAALEAPGEAPDRSKGLETRASAPSSTNAKAPSVTSGHEEYVITRVGTPDLDDAGQAALEPPDARLFADLVLRESVVKAASFVYGVRRGLSPANRNRIWFEMRREVKRARKQRKADEREAVREWRARQRASLREEDAA